MKMVVAIIQPNKFDEVRQALARADVTRMTVSRCTGHGRPRDDIETDLYRGQALAPDLTAKVRVEIAVNDEFLDATIDAILEGAREGGSKAGDGKIFVMPLLECVRVRTGERGGTAI